MTRRCMTPALLGLALLGLALPSTGAAASEECGPNACVAGAKWASGEVLTDKERERERKRGGKSNSAHLTVQTNDKRGSLFIDGIWAAPVPALYVPLAAGKHDIEVRDGQTVLARGVLTIGKNGGDVTVRVL